MKTLYLVRGVSGCGKSTFAEKLPVDHIFSADMYFIDPLYNTYNFKPALLPQAHKFCQDNTEMSMTDLKDIAVANTFTEEWEMKPYYDMAEKHGYTVFSIIVENRHEGQNVHSVPEFALEKMRNRFEIKL